MGLESYMNAHQEIETGENTTMDNNINFDLVADLYDSYVTVNTDLQFMALRRISEHLKHDGVFICTLQNQAVRLKTADGITRKLGKFKLDEDRKMTVSSSNKFNPDTDTQTCTSDRLSNNQLYPNLDKPEPNRKNT